MTETDHIERWKPIPGLPGYEASDQGRIRSLRRGSPRLLKATVGPCGFHTATVAGGCRQIGVLVAAAWLGPRPEEGAREVRHLDGDPRNDRLENLAYGTLEEVRADHAARARREEAAGAATHCPEGHRYADTWLGNWGARYCYECQKAAERERQAKQREYHHRWYKAHYRPRKPLTTACVDCGDDVAQTPGPGGIVLRCAPCRVDQQRVYEQRYRAKGKNAPRISRCIDCGVKITNQGPGPLALRCVPHKMLAARAADRRYRQQASA